MTYIFYTFTCDIIRVDKESFETIRKTHKLNCNFEDYLDLINKILENSVENIENHKVDFYHAENSNALIEIFAKNELRDFLLISFDLAEAPLQLIDSMLSYKFGLASAKNRLLENRLLEIYDIVKKSNPILGKEIKDLLLNV